MTVTIRFVLCLRVICVRMATCMELYIDTLGGLDLDGSMDKNLTYFVVENLATIYYVWPV